MRPPRRPTDYSYSPEWRAATLLMDRVEWAPRPHCKSPRGVVQKAMRTTRRVREQRDALRGARKEHHV